jgi:hypothetical protein
MDERWMGPSCGTLDRVEQRPGTLVLPPLPAHFPATDDREGYCLSSTTLLYLRSTICFVVIHIRIHSITADAA